MACAPSKKKEDKACGTDPSKKKGESKGCTPDPMPKKKACSPKDKKPC